MVFHCLKHTIESMVCRRWQQTAPCCGGCWLTNLVWSALACGSPCLLITCALPLRRGPYACSHAPPFVHVCCMPYPLSAERLLLQLLLVGTHSFQSPLCREAFDSDYCTSTVPSSYPAGVACLYHPQTLICGVEFYLASCSSNSNVLLFIPACLHRRCVLPQSKLVFVLVA